MAGFEQAQMPAMAEAVREWRGARFAPLYVAGIALGVALGVGARWYNDQPSSWQNAPAAQVATVARDVPAAPIVALAAEAPARDVDAAAADLTTLAAWLESDALIAAPAQVDLQVQPATEPAAPAPITPAAPAALPIAPASPIAQNPPAVQPVAPVAAPAAPALKPNFYLPEPKSGPMTDLEQRLLAGLNQERVAAGLRPYVLDAGLSRVARIRSQQLVDQKYFAHVDPYGYSMYVELLALGGYAYAWAGENLALNNYGVAESPERALITLMKSPTHRANILAGDFFRIGIGEVTTADGGHYYTMIFLG